MDFGAGGAGGLGSAVCVGAGDAGFSTPTTSPGAALFERHFASRSAVIIAERIAAIVKVALPIAVIIALIIFALINPLM